MLGAVTTMPELSGIEAANELRKRASRVRFVFLTVHEDRDFVRKTLNTGAFGYVEFGEGM